MPTGTMEKLERLLTSEPKVIQGALVEAGKAFILAEELRMRGKLLRLTAAEMKLAGHTEEHVKQLLDMAQMTKAEAEEAWKRMRQNVAYQFTAAQQRLGLDDTAKRRVKAMERRARHARERAYREEKGLCRRCKKSEVQPARPGKTTCVECAAVDAEQRAKRAARKK